MNIKEILLKEKAAGNIVIASEEGLLTSDLQEFIKQPTEGILYDLNRNEAVRM